MNDSLISVVLPTFNGERYLHESIDSILNQTYKNIELIIVNDCSTDATAKIADSFKCKDNRVRVINNPVNMKLPASLNIGFQNAKGVFFTWTSDDNRYHPTALEDMYNALASDPRVGVVYAGYRRIGMDGFYIDSVLAKPPEALITVNCVGCCFLFQKEVYDVLQGYDTKLFLVEDYDFWLRASLKFKMLAINNIIYDYRVHPDSLSSTRAHDVHRLHEELLRNMLPKMKWVPKEPWFAALHAMYLRSGWAAFMAGDRRCAFSNGISSLKLNPMHEETWRLLICSLIKKSKVTNY